MQSLADRHGLVPTAPVMLAQEGTQGRCYAAADLFHALLAEVESLRAERPEQARGVAHAWVDVGGRLHHRHERPGPPG